MPISNRFIHHPGEDEYLYDLSLGICEACRMVQLEECVEPEMMFNEDYAFFSSTSSAMADHFREMADRIIDIVSEKPSPFVVELGCNDGILLQHFVKGGVPHLGIEPSANVAQSAREKGVRVMETFFNTECARKIKDRYGMADVICGANVMCHIEDINSVFAGVTCLLQPDGVFFFEDPYILDIVEKTSFDQIYDEHVFYFSGLSVSRLAERHGLRLIHMEAQNVHGGSMRYYLKKKDVSGISTDVERHLARERELMLHKVEGYHSFSEHVNRICNDLKETLLELHSSGKRIAAYGATSKSTTLLNYAGIGADLIAYISDTTPTKIGKFTPGTHIPIRSHDFFSDDVPPYTLLLAWNHRDEILKKEKHYREKGGRFITFFPKVAIE